MKKLLFSFLFLSLNSVSAFVVTVKNNLNQIIKAEVIKTGGITALPDKIPAALTTKIKKFPAGPTYIKPGAIGTFSLGLLKLEKVIIRDLSNRQIAEFPKNSGYEPGATCMFCDVNLEVLEITQNSNKKVEIKEINKLAKK